MNNFVTQPESFAKRLIDILKRKFSNNLEFDFQMVIKTNDCHKPALIVKEPEHQVGKTIYIDDAIRRYTEEGVDIEALADDLVSICEMKSEFEELTGSYLFEKMQDLEYLLDGHITLKLVNKEKNEKYLQGKAHISFLDLAVLFCMTLKDDETGIGTIVIPEEITKHWNISLEEAFEKVLAVTERDYPIIRNTMMEFMLELIRKQCCDFKELRLEDLDPAKEMYIQTNKQNFNGSITMLYKKNLFMFCEEKGIDSVFILPSSLHEIILVPRFKGADEKCLQSMISEINATQVAADEVLSDNLYIYNKDTDEITIWND